MRQFLIPVLAAAACAKPAVEAPKPELPVGSLERLVANVRDTCGMLGQLKHDLAPIDDDDAKTWGAYASACTEGDSAPVPEGLWYDGYLDDEICFRYSTNTSSGFIDGDEIQLYLVAVRSLDELRGPVTPPPSTALTKWRVEELDARSWNSKHEHALDDDTKIVTTSSHSRVEQRLCASPFTFTPETNYLVAVVWRDASSESDGLGEMLHFPAKYSMMTWTLGRTPSTNLEIR